MCIHCCQCLIALSLDASNHINIMYHIISVSAAHVTSNRKDSNQICIPQPLGNLCNKTFWGQCALTQLWYTIVAYTNLMLDCPGGLNSLVGTKSYVRRLQICRQQQFVCVIILFTDNINHTLCINAITTAVTVSVCFQINLKNAHVYCKSVWSLSS